MRGKRVRARSLINWLTGGVAHVWLASGHGCLPVARLDLPTGNYVKQQTADALLKLQNESREENSKITCKKKKKNCAWTLLINFSGSISSRIKAHFLWDYFFIQWRYRHRATYLGWRRWKQVLRAVRACVPPPDQASKERRLEFLCTNAVLQSRTAWITMLWKTRARQGDARSSGDRAEKRFFSFFLFFVNLSERVNWYRVTAPPPPWLWHTLTHTKSRCPTVKN